ncbi:RPII140-upstream gene protein [Sabethes cyaneus]|uniref:RPII140-upstream gene protein n=1 Tax=Sabethes cyaneus TaxID=53552 RepID=UPI00221E36F8|nr:RPII140-upstream gene protein [Sabethes cyaneus]
MFRTGKRLFPRGVTLISGIFSFSINDSDKVDNESVQKMFANAPGDHQTGTERLHQMFTLDEFGRISSEVNAIYQAGFLGFLTGACYGGFIQSRVAYMNFMERNQATAFKTSFEAKRKLQDAVTVNFAKGAFKWGWRLALFTTGYVGIQTIISVYRGKSSIWEYLAAGGTAGALYKFNMGLKGMTSGGLVGLAFGGVAGVISLGILKASGTTMEEVRFWQYKWKAHRDTAILESMKRQTPPESDPLLEIHHAKFGTDVSLDKIETVETSVESSSKVKQSSDSNTVQSESHVTKPDAKK